MPEKRMGSINQIIISMKKQFVLTIVMISIFTSFTLAQDSLSIRKGKVFQKKNTIYAELAGRSLIYSINYDRIFWQNKWFNLSGKAGFTYLNNTYLIPLSVALFTGKKKGHFEISYTVVFNPSKYNYPLVPYTAFGAGYRYQNPTGKGLFFSATAYLLYTPSGSVTADNIYVIPWAGIGIGKSF